MWPNSRLPLPPTKKPSFLPGPTSAQLLMILSQCLQDVDEAHYAYSFKYLKNKPVKELRDDQFLKIGLAEDEGLLTIDISIDMKGVEG